MTFTVNRATHKKTLQKVQKQSITQSKHRKPKQQKHKVKRTMTVQSLTLDGCFLIHLLKVESFSVLIENPILRGVYEHDL